MEILILIIGYICISIGCFFIASSVLGIIRFPDFFTRMHAAGISDSCGIPIFLIGLAFLQSDLNSSLKLLTIVFITLVLSPVTAHALIKAAWLGNNKANLNELKTSETIKKKINE